MVIDDLEPMMAVSEDDMVLVKHTSDELQLDDPVLSGFILIKKRMGNGGERNRLCASVSFAKVLTATG